MLDKTMKFRPICLRNFRISSTLLKEAASISLTLKDIGNIICRPDEDDSIPSVLEVIV